MKVDNNKDIKFLGKYFIDVSSEVSWSIEKSKVYDFILKIAIRNVERYLPFLIFLNSHAMIGTSDIQFGQPLCST